MVLGGYCCVQKATSEGCWQMLGENKSNTSAQISPTQNSQSAGCTPEPMGAAPSSTEQHCTMEQPLSRSEQAQVAQSSTTAAPSSTEQHSVALNSYE